MEETVVGGGGGGGCGELVDVGGFVGGLVETRLWFAIAASSVYSFSHARLGQAP